MRDRLGSVFRPSVDEAVVRWSSGVVAGAGRARGLRRDCFPARSS
ncbi:hypothetical protein [Streptomyces sp. S.PNR 29]|nr:hypothetical protein [Streptomyces sp. S.PNR 29]MDN0195637.1 hypothetical protein [Streptomyces sp. S.PNR 29]